MRCKWLIFTLLFATIPALAEKFHLNPTPVAPAAIGDVDIGRDGNGNTRIELKAEHLAHPADLSPPMDVYVVWLQSPDKPPENIGELKIGGNLKGELKAVTPVRDFDLIVTAEHDPRITAMTGPVVMKATVHQR